MTDKLTRVVYLLHHLRYDLKYNKVSKYCSRPFYDKLVDYMGLLPKADILNAQRSHALKVYTRIKKELLFDLSNCISYDDVLSSCTYRLSREELKSAGITNHMYSKIYTPKYGHLPTFKQFVKELDDFSRAHTDKMEARYIEDLFVHKVAIIEMTEDYAPDGYEFEIYPENEYEI